MENDKTIEKLKEENEKMRKDINNLLDIPKLTASKEYFKASIWEKINELVENELQQEELCTG